MYQSVPAPQGAKLQVLPAERVLVTVAGTTYYLCSNTFYRRVVEGAQEHFVVVTAPAGVVFVAALPADFTVVQLNTMYFLAAGRYYVPFLATDGKEMYVMVDRRRNRPRRAAPGRALTAAAPPATAPPRRAAPAAAAGSGRASASRVASRPAGRREADTSRASGAASPARSPGHRLAARRAVRTVAVVRFAVVPSGTLIVVRARRRFDVGQRERRRSVPGIPRSGSRHQRPSRHDARQPGLRHRHRRRSRAEDAHRDARPTCKVGDRVLSITTQALDAPGGVIRAQSPQAFTVAAPFQWTS